jgi:hypothetical protein
LQDPELFFTDANTLIYLYSRGRSQRGPSFRIPYEYLLYSGCRPLVEQSLISTLSSSPYDDEEHSPASGESYLYLHAPQDLTREESFAYHVTTRNFFAWLMGVPIVGHDPVSALLALKDRMDVWRDPRSDNLKAICDYVQEQGYGDMSQLEARLSPVPKPTLYRDRTSRHGGNATYQKLVAKSGSAAAARQTVRRKLRLSETSSHLPHIADLVRPQKKDHLSIRIPLREGDLATIAYEDTLASTAPSTTTGQPKPKHARSLGRNSTYTEILVPDYGNGLDNPTLALATIITTSSPTSPTSPSYACVRGPSQISQDTAPPPSPSSSTSSRNSHVPSLSSTYSTEGESPSPASPTGAAYTFYDAPTTQEDLPSEDAAHVKIAGDGGGNEPDRIIDALIGELEAAEMEGKPRYDGSGMEKSAKRAELPG